MSVTQFSHKETQFVKRRNFIVATSATALSAITMRAQEKIDKDTREYYELRQYQFQIGDKRNAANAYLKNALVPALNRAGLQPIGVFDVVFGDVTTLIVLIPHKSSESILTLPLRLMGDSEYNKAGAEFLDTPSSSPAFVRMESSLMRAFNKMPKLELPDSKRPRVFELRRYESHSEKASQKKIEMFNDAGEMALFRRIGFRPVFFGETIIGPRMPNFQYLLTFDNFAAREKLWAEFRVDPEWKKMSAIEEYRDNKILSHISSTILNPASYSQI
jgi:NIPSNAP